MKELFAKLDKLTKGYKRHIGAVVTILPTVLLLAGVDDATSKQIIELLQKAGIIIFGAGWLDTLRK